MNFLLDQGVPRRVPVLLKAHGIEAMHVSELGLARANDEDILNLAEKRASFLVTLDADFHQLLAASHRSSPSVIRFRIEGFKAEGFAEMLVEVVNKCHDDLMSGAVLSVSARRIRVHKLPLP